VDTDTTGVAVRRQRRKRRLCSDGNISTDGDDNFQVHINNEVTHYRNKLKGFVVHNLQSSSV
jgi:hypothetical protein